MHNLLGSHFGNDVVGQSRCREGMQTVRMLFGDQVCPRGVFGCSKEVALTVGRENGHGAKGGSATHGYIFGLDQPNHGREGCFVAVVVDPYPCGREPLLQIVDKIVRYGLGLFNEDRVFVDGTSLRTVKGLGHDTNALELPVSSR